MKKWFVMVLACLGLVQAQDTETPFSGLIVDARAQHFMPCESPKIFAPDGTEIWGTFSVSSQFINEFGIASFVKTLEEARTLKARGAPNQLLVKAVKVVWDCEVVISSEDVVKVRLADQKAGFLADFRVTFLY